MGVERGSGEQKAKIDYTIDCHYFPGDLANKESTNKQMDVQDIGKKIERWAHGEELSGKESNRFYRECL